MSFAALVGFAGVILICSGVFKYLNARSFVKKSLTVDGTVIGYKEEFNIECPVYSYPIIKFNTKDGSEISFKDKNGVYYRNYKKGDVVTIAYMPENPTKALICSEINPLKDSTYVLTLGIILLCVSFI